MKGHKFGTVINCMDGRVQIPGINYLMTKYSLDYVDSITEAGPNAILANGGNDRIFPLREKIEISVNIHKSKIIAIVGHCDCAGNPASNEKQINDILISINKLKEWFPNIEIIGIWLDDFWHLEQLT